MPRTSALPVAVLAAALLSTSCASERWRPPSRSTCVDPAVLAGFRLTEERPATTSTEALAEVPSTPAAEPAVQQEAGAGAEPGTTGPWDQEASASTAGGGGAGSHPGAPPADEGAAAEPAEHLRLEDVLRSVEGHFPLILAALEEVEIAAGKAESAAGAFDTKLSAKGDFELEGFYENDVVDIGLEQPTTLWGSTVEGGWRRGDGSFPVYEGKDKTNTDGEWRLGVTVPLLQGGSTDPRRVALWKARLDQEQVEPRIIAKRLAATRKAAEAYWKWLAAGRKRNIALDLLTLAQRRQDQVRISVEEGELAEINLVDNERLIVDRTTKLVSSEQRLARAALALSLYWRDAQGEPAVPGVELLPEAFPDPRSIESVLVPDDEMLALDWRPELQELQLELEQLGLDRDLARNQMLPALDVGVFASQDQGRAVNSPDDKDDFELEARLRLAVPLQQRKPRGARRSTEAKIVKLEQELRFVRDLVVNEVRDAVTTLRRTLERLDQARRNVELARQLEEAERLQLELGQSDLFRVNLREQQSALAAQGLVDVLAEHYLALAGYRAVLGLPYDEVVNGDPVGGGTP